MVSGRNSLNAILQRITKLGLLLLIVGGLPLLLVAEDKAKPASPSTENPTAKANPTSLFIPKEELGSALSRYGKGVLIPWEEFQKLLAASAQDREIQSLGAAPILSEHSQTSLKIVGTTLHVAADIQLRQWRETPQIWTLPLGFPALQRATFDDQPAELSLNPQTAQLSLLSRKSGSHRLHLEYTLPIRTAAQGQFLSVPLLPSPSAKLSLTLPADSEIQTVTASPLRESTEAGGKVLEWAVGGLNSWQGLLRSTKQAADKTSTLWVESIDQIQINRAQAAWTSRISLHPFGAPLQQLTADLPRGLTLTSVTGDSLLSWKLEPAQETTRLQLNFRQLNPLTTQLTITGFLANNAEAWNIAIPRWSSSGQSSYLTVEDSADQLLSIAELKQGELLDSHVRPQSGLASRHHLWNLRILDKDFQVRLTPVRPVNEFQTNQKNTLHLATDRLEYQSDVTFLPLARPVPQQVDLELPADWVLTHLISIDPQSRSLDWEFINDKPGVHKIRVVWKQPLPPQTTTRIRLTAHRTLEHWPLEDNSVSFSLPMLQVANSYRNSGHLRVTSVDPLQLLPKNLQGLTSLSESAENLLAAFQFSASTATGELQVSRLPPQIAAMSLTSAQLERENLRCDWESRIQVGGGGTRQIRVSLPERCGDAVRFTLHNSEAEISQQSVSPPEKGERIWTIKFDRLLLGDAELFTTLLVPRGKETSFLIPLPGFPDAERQSGQVAIQGDDEQLLIVEGKDAAGQPLPELAPADLKPQTHYTLEHRVVAAYRTLAQGTTITLQEQRHPGEVLPVAYCRELRLKSILSPESPRLFEARWTLQAGRIAGWGLHIPNGARLWSVQLNGAPVEVRHSDRIDTFIAAPQSTGVSDQNLTVIYEDAILDDDPLGTEHQSMPLLQVVTSGHDVRPLLVMAYHWDVRHSRDLVLSNSETPIQEIHQRASRLNPWEWLRNWTFSYWQLYQLFIVLGCVIVLTLLSRLFRFLFSTSSTGTIVTLAVLAGVMLIALILPLRNNAQRHGRFIPDDLARPSAGTVANTQPKPAPAIKGINPNFTSRPLGPSSESAPPKAARPQPQVQPPPQAPAVQSNVLGMARLSVVTELNPPADFLQHRYFYEGGTAAQNPTLVIRYCQLDFMAPQLLILAVGAAFVCWLTRKRAGAWRFWGFLGVILPLAAGAWLSREWHPLLIAAINGTLAGGLLVLLWHISQRLTQTPPMDAPFAEATKSLTISLFLLFALGFASSASAAEPALPSKPNPPAPPVARPIEPVIVPLDDLLHPEKAARVWVPWDTYLKLKTPDSSADSHKTQPGVTELHLQGMLVPPNDNATLSATFKARILLVSPDQEPREIHLPLDQCDILAGQLNGQPAKLIAPDSAHPTWRVIVEKAGPSVLDAEIRLTSVQGTPVKGQLTLPIRSTPAGTCELGFETADLRLSLRANRSVTWRKTPRTPQGTTLLFTLGQTDHPTINWSSAPTTPSLARARTVSRVDLQVTPRVQQKLILELDPAQSAELRIPLPTTLIPQSLTTTGISGWELAGAADKRELVLTPDANSSSAEVDIDFLIPQSPPSEFKPLTIPRLFPTGLQPQEQEVTLTAQSDVQFQVAPQPGWKQGELLPTAASKTQPLKNLVQVWRSTPSTGELSLTWSRRQTPWKVQSYPLWQIEPDRITQQTIFRWARDTHHSSTLKFSLPAGFIIDQVQWTSRKLVLPWTVEEPEPGKRFLLVDLPERNPLPHLEPQILLWVTGAQPRTEKDTALQLAPLGLEGATSLETWAEVELHPSLQANWQTSADWKSIDRRELVDQFWGQNPLRTTFVSRVSKTPGPLTAQLQTAVSQQTGTSLTIIDVQDDVVDYLFALKWEVTQAAEKRLSVTTPASLRGRLRFVPPSGRQSFQTQTEDAAAGRIRWTLLLEEPVSGPFFVIAHASVPPSSDGSAVAPTLQFEQPAPQANTFRPLATQLHYQSLVNHSRFQLEWQATAQAQRVRLEEINRSLTVPQELMRQSVDLLRLSENLTENRWRAFSYQTTQLLPASVNLADHLLWITPDGTWRAKVRFKLTNRARQFLAVRIPPEATLLAAHAKGQPVRPLRSTSAAGQEDTHLIPLPRTSAGDLAFEVNLVLTGKLTTPWTSWGAPQAVDLPLTHVVSQQEDASLGIPVARELLTVFLPEKTSATVVHNPARSNAEFGSEDSRLYDEAEDLLSEMSSLIQIQSSSQNEQTRELAKNNLDLLNRRLDEYSSQSQSTSDEGKLGSRKQEFQRRAGEISRSRGLLEQYQPQVIPSDSSRKPSSTDGIDVRRKLVPQQQSIQGNDFLNEKAERLYQQNTIVSSQPNEQSQESSPERRRNFNRFPKKDRNSKFDLDVKSNAKDQTDGSESVTRPAPPPNAEPQGQAKQEEQSETKQLPPVMDVRKEGERLPPYGIGGLRTPSNAPNTENRRLPLGGKRGDSPSEGDDMAGAMGGGGMGGGMGGGAEGLAKERKAKALSQADRGTLSLPIEFQPTGRKLVFSHLNGDMKLALTLWPHEAFRQGIAVLWTGTLLIAGLFLLKGHRPLHPWLAIGTLLALMVFLALPATAPWGYFAGLLAILLAVLYLLKQKPQPI